MKAQFPIKVYRVTDAIDDLLTVLRDNHYSLTEAERDIRDQGAHVDIRESLAKIEGQINGLEMAKELIKKDTGS